MSQENPDWQGRILVKKFNQDGTLEKWVLSNTRQTRDAAYHYLVNRAGFQFDEK